MNLKNSSSLQRVLNIWGIVLVIWIIYRKKLSLPEWFDEIIAKPFVFILPTYLYIKRFEKKPYFDQIWLKSKNISSDIVLGVILGLIFSASAIIANYVRYGSFDFIAKLISQNLIFAVIITIFTATSEEVLSRGFILKRLYDDSKNMYSAVFLNSILFLILHFPILLSNSKLSGSLILLFLGTDFILSLVNSFVFIERKSLLAPILIHALYNISILLYV